MRFIVSCLICVLFTSVNSYAQLPYSDSFKNSIAPGSEFGGTGFVAKLTAGAGDPEGAGYLRLTEIIGGAQTGYARNTAKFSSDRGLLVTFEYYTYGGTPVGQEGDGISFFLYDASVVNEPSDGAVYTSGGFVIGGPGGALGYANFDGTPGLRKGYLGIGIDEFGNFATKDHSKQTGEEIVNPDNTHGRIRENITLRGDGDGLGTATNYEYLIRALTNAGPSAFLVQGKVDGRTKGPGGLTPNDPGYRKATIELIPNGSNTGYKINVWITEGKPSGPVEHHVITDYLYVSTNTIPAELSYGFAASTGGSTNIHEIRNIDIVVPPSQAVAPVAVNDNLTTLEDTPITFSIVSNDYDANGNSTLNLTSVDLDMTQAGEQKEFINSAGTYRVDDAGLVTFTPAANFNGPAPVVSYTLKDRGYGTVPALGSNIATITVNVSPVNDAPTVAAIAVTGPEDTSIPFTGTDFTSKFSDIDGDAFVKIKIASLPANGTLRKSGIPITLEQEIILAELGSITFTPALNFYGNTSFLWNASDGSAYSASNGAVNITITPVDDDPPIAVNDFENTETDVPVTINVVANDTDPDGQGTINVASLDIDPAPGTQVVFTVAGQGTYVANNNGTVTFTPVSSYQSGGGTATPITYTVKDNTGLISNAATITIRVTPKTAPVSNPDEAITLEDSSVTFSLIANDTDLNGNNTIDAASVDLDPNTAGRQNSITVPGQGTYTVNSSGLLTFVPVPNYNSGTGSATSISYTVSDRGGLVSNISSITVIVTPVPDAPVAIADAPTTTEDNSVTFSVTANDSDADGNNTIDQGSIDFDPGAGIQTVLTIAGEGTYTAGSNGTVTFVPIANYHSGSGTATPISYTIKDITGLTSNAAQIAVTVISVNDLPTVSNITKTVNSGDPFVFTDTDFKGKFNDPEGSPLNRIKVVSLPQNGSLKLYGSSITIGQEIPVNDLEGITFVPTANWSGTTSFAWNGYDGLAYALANANVILNVVGINHPPVLTTVSKTYIGNQPVSFTALDFTSQFSDPDGNTLTKIKIVTLPGSGTLKLYGIEISAGQEIPIADVAGITYTAAPGGGGAFSFSWNGSDGTTYATAPSTIVINVSLVNLPPVVTDLSKSGTGFTPITFALTDFTSKFTDPDNNALVKVKVVSLPANGMLLLNGVNVTAGQEITVSQLPGLTFHPNVNWSGTTAFSWNGFDGSAYAVNNANVNISIILPADPNAKIGLAKKLSSIIDGINGSYNVKFLFTLVNFGPNTLENISLTDNLAQLFAGTEFTVKGVTSFGNLKSNSAFNGQSVTELLLPTSKLNSGEEAQLELELNIRLLTNSGTFHNYAFAEGTSAITGMKVQDRSTNGLKPDPLINGDVSLAETTPFELAPKPIFVPQGFTPNNDGINDYLIIQNSMNQKVAIEIFNRWGNRIYRSTEYKNDWSGKCTEGMFLGQDIPDGTYFYVVVVGNKDKYVGSLTVQR